MFVIAQECLEFSTYSLVLPHYFIGLFHTVMILHIFLKTRPPLITENSLKGTVFTCFAANPKGYY